MEVWRWRHSDPAFIAALNRERHAAWDAAAETLRGITKKALSVIDRALDEGDISAALSVLRMMQPNLPDPRPAGATTPEEIERQQGLAETMAKRQHELEEVLAAM